MSAEASPTVLETWEGFSSAINKQWIWKRPLSCSPVKCALGNLLNEYWAVEDMDTAVVFYSSVHLSAVLSQVVDITQPWLHVFIQTVDIRLLNDIVVWFFLCIVEKSHCGSFQSRSISVKKIVINHFSSSLSFYHLDCKLTFCVLI